MTLEEALQKANAGDVDAMDALSDYYADNDDMNESLKWSIEAAEHGSVKSTELSVFLLNTWGKNLKTEEKFDQALTVYVKAAQVALKGNILSGTGGLNTAFDGLNNSIYNEAYCLCRSQDAYDTYNRAYEIICMGDTKNHLKSKVFLIYNDSLDTSCQATEAYKTLMGVTSAIMKREDLAGNPVQQLYHAFDKDDEYMFTVSCAKCANALRDAAKNLPYAKQVLEHGASVVTVPEFSEYLRKHASKYTTTMFGKTIYRG